MISIDKNITIYGMYNDSVIEVKFDIIKGRIGPVGILAVSIGNHGATGTLLPTRTTFTSILEVKAIQTLGKFGSMIAEQWTLIRQGCKQPALAPSVDIEPDGSSNTYFIAPYAVLCSVWSTDWTLKQIVAMAGITNTMPWRDDAFVIFMVPEWSRGP